MEPVFLTVDEILYIHREQISMFGGALGVRDTALLQSAVAQPAAAFGGQYLHRDLPEMAAAYLFHVVQNHPFLDGNKRVGLEAALVFLGLNGFEVEADEDALYELVIAVACGKADKRMVADFLRDNTLP